MKEILLSYLTYQQNEILHKWSLKKDLKVGQFCLFWLNSREIEKKYNVKPGTFF